MTVTSDDANDGIDCRGEADLIFGEFLSRFHSYFQHLSPTANFYGDAKQPLFLRDDIVRILREKVDDIDLLRNIRLLSKGYYGANKELTGKNDDATNDELKSLTEERDRRQNERMNDGNAELLRCVLQRLEVWATKNIASYALLPKKEKRNSLSSSQDVNNYCCYLLNLPDTKTLCHLFPPIESSSPPPNNLPENDDDPVLPLPPNSLTWREYLRLSLMVSALPSHDYIQESFESSLAAVSSSILLPTATEHAENTEKSSTALLLAESTEFTSSDLVALWVRAQRNTGAMRHLIQLFSFETVVDDKGGSKDNRDVRNDGKEGGGKDVDFGNGENICRYRAKFRGNSKRTRGKVCDETSLVDTLSELAVTNQVLFTQTICCTYINSMANGDEAESDESSSGKKSSEQHSSSGKRKRSSEDSDASVKTRVRRSRRRISRDSIATGFDDDDDDNSNSNKNQTDAKLVDDVLNTPTLPEPTIPSRASFLLRWFARRNRRHLSVVFSSSKHPTLYEFPTFSSTIKNLDSMTQSIKTDLLKRTQSSDRTLARIDRRITIGKYQKEEDFLKTVTLLLEALERNAMDEEMREGARRAIQDFGAFLEVYLKPKGGEKYPPLVDVDFYENSGEDSEGDISSLLMSHPVPWIDHCHVCSKGSMSDHGKRMDMIECANCGTVVHRKCAALHLSQDGDKDEDACGDGGAAMAGETDENETSKSLDYRKAHMDLLDVYSSLLDVYKSFDPLYYSKLLWKEEIIELKRPKSDNPTSWGISMLYTEDVTEDMLNIYSDVDNDASSKNSIRMNLPHVGLVVKEPVPGFPAKEYGVKTDDIITQIGVKEKHVDNDNNTGETNSKKRSRRDENKSNNTTDDMKWYNISLMKMDKRIEIFREKYSEINLVVQRPYLAKNQHFIPFWYCGSCSTSITQRLTNVAGDKARYIDKATIVNEARNCRAVIRRLGMEWCSFPFHNEEVNASQRRKSPTESSPVSLRRLDLMMTYILCKNMTGDEMKHFRPTLFDPFEDSLTRSKSRRSSSETGHISWAPLGVEKRPRELLCLGIKAMIDNTADGSFQEERTEFLSRFLYLFRTWCLDTDVSYTDDGQPIQPLVKSPPKQALLSVEPWIDQRCDVCGVRKSFSPFDESFVKHNGNVIDETLAVTLDLHVCESMTCRAYQGEALVMMAEKFGLCPYKNVKNHKNVHDGEKQTLENNNENNTKDTASSMDVSGSSKELESKEETSQSGVQEHKKDKDDQSEVNMEDSESKTETSNDNPPKNDVKVHPTLDFYYWSSLVGTIIIVLPGDPVLSKISSGINASIEHLNRAVEMIIISYWPYSCEESLDKNGGYFHAIPILSVKQMKDATAFWQMRRKPPKHMNDYHKCAELDVHTLPFVVKIENKEMLRRIDESNAIHTAIDVKIMEIARCGEDYVSTEESDSNENTSNPLFVNHALYSLAMSEDYIMDFVRSSQDIRLYSSATDTSTKISKHTDVPRIGLGGLDPRDYVYEYVAMIDALTTNESKPIRDTLDQLFKAKKLQYLEYQKYSSRMTYSPEIETDIGESDNDDNFLKVRTRKRNLHGSTKYQLIDVDDGYLDDSSGKKHSLLPNGSAYEDGCQVCYMDFTPDDLTREADAMGFCPVLRRPRQFDSNSSGDNSVTSMVITLTRLDNSSSTNSEKPSEGDDKTNNTTNSNKEKGADSASSKYSGKGWGLELVKWATQKRILRIGRIYPNSPAEKAKLQQHDVVTSINGKDVHSIGPDTALARAMLWNHSSNEPPDAPSLENGLNPAAFLLSKMSLPVSGPVVLEIERVKDPLPATPVAAPPKSPTMFALENSNAILKDTLRGHEAKTSSENESNSTKGANAPSHSSPLNLPVGNQVKLNGRTSSTAQSIPTQALVQGQSRSVSNTTTTTITTPGISTYLQNHHQQPNTAVKNRTYDFPSSKSTSNLRMYLSPEHLYASGIPNSILTCVETVVLLEAALRKFSALGVRLLCPRYDARRLQREYTEIISPYAKNYLHTVPKLTDAQWSAILRADHQRSLKETGPAVFKENGYAYRVPTEILPLDRLMEEVMANTPEVQRYRQSHANNLPSPQSDCMASNRVSLAAIKLHSNLWWSNGQPPSPITQQTHQQHSYTTPSARYQPHNGISNTSKTNNYVSYLHNQVPQVDNNTNYNYNQNQKNQFQQNIPNPLATGISSTQYAQGAMAQNANDMTQNTYNYNTVPDVIDLTEANPEGTLNNYHPAQTGNSYPERIRGGGDDNTGAARKFLLSHYDRKNWEGMAVCGKCVTTQDRNYSGEATLIGNVEAAHSNEGYAIVRVFYVSNAGFLSEPVIRDIQASDLHIITNKSSWSSIVHEYKARIKRSKEMVQKKEVKSKPKSPSTLDARSHVAQAASTTISQPKTSASTTTNSSQSFSTAAKKSPSQPKSLGSYTLNMAAENLINRLYLRLDTSTPLGILPDGRAICWFQHDPKALYIRDDNYSSPQYAQEAALEEAQRQYRVYIQQIARINRKRLGLPNPVNSLQSCKRGRFCCLWGCSEIEKETINGRVQRRILSFLTKESLAEHMAVHHNFSCNDKTDSRKKIIRMSEGESIKFLCSDLTSAISARCPDVSHIVVPVKFSDDGKDKTESKRFFHCFFQKRTIFLHEKILDISDAGRGGPNFTQSLNKVTSAKVRNLIRLWSRIFRLFAIEKDGKFRLKDIIPKSKANEDKENQTNENSKDQAKERMYCKIATWNGDKETLKDCLKCSVCALPSEKNLQLAPTKELSNKSEPSLQQPVGCILYTEACFPNYSNDLTEQLYDAIQNHLVPPLGRLDTLKLLLLNIVTKIPNYLHKRIHFIQRDRKQNISIWRPPQLEIWIDFVIKSLNARMLFQAFVVLLSSINSHKLPKWFKAARSGWSSMTMTAQGPSLSALAMRLFIFDMALAEILTSHSSKKDLNNGKTKSSDRKGSLSDLRNAANESAQGLAQADRETAVLQSLNELKSVSAKKRMTTIMNWALDMNVKPFQGESNDSCELCGDGGELMCCEFCNMVIHVKCCSPPMKKFPDFDYICEECIKDINQMWIYSSFATS